MSGRSARNTDAGHVSARLWPIQESPLLELEGSLIDIVQKDDDLALVSFRNVIKAGSKMRSSIF